MIFKRGKILKKTYVWSIYTVVFHWLLAFLFVIAFLSAEFDSFFAIHVASGVSLAILIAFRVVFGFLDIRYSKFKDFSLSKDELKSYLFNLFNKKRYVGHNPASSYVILSILATIFLAVISGFLLYGFEGNGILSFLENSFFAEIAEEIHELFANLALLFIGLHIAGVLFDKFISRGDSFDSIITGYKRVEAEDVELKITHKLIAVIFLLSSIVAFFYISVSSETIFYSSEKEKIYKESDKDRD